MITLILEEYEAEVLKKSINMSLDTYRNEATEKVCDDCSALENLLKKL